MNRRCMNDRERATASPHLLVCQVVTGFQLSQDLCDISRPVKQTPGQARSPYKKSL